ncbi:MAG: DNA repair protein RecO [Paraprevotella sp.]|nr:DNA repair protein RecO [Paraprevotella sp.]
MQEKTQGVVLRALKYNDNAQIVDIYTATRGTVSFMVKFPRSRKSAMKSVLFRPLSILEIDFEYRPKSNLQRIGDVRFGYTYQSLPYEPYKASMALFLAEFLCRVLKHEAENGPLFAYILYSLQWLDASERSFSNFHLVFITRLTRFFGFYPNVETWHEGDYFDMLNACFVPVPPFHQAYLRPREAATIPLFMRMNYDSMRFFAMNRQERERYIEVLNAYYRLHVPDFPELKSLDVLKEVFS